MKENSGKREKQLERETTCMCVMTQDDVILTVFSSGPVESDRSYRPPSPPKRARLSDRRERVPVKPSKKQSVEIPELSPSGLILMRVFFHEIISAGDDRSFMEVMCGFFPTCMFVCEQ